jgi:hypothetical protein
MASRLTTGSLASRPGDGEVPVQGGFPAAIAFQVRPQYVEPDKSYSADLTTLLDQRYTAQRASRVAGRLPNWCAPESTWTARVHWDASTPCGRDIGTSSSTCLLGQREPDLRPRLSGNARTALLPIEITHGEGSDIQHGAQRPAGRVTAVLSNFDYTTGDAVSTAHGGFTRIDTPVGLKAGDRRSGRGRVSCRPNGATS